MWWRSLASLKATYICSLQSRARSHDPQTLLSKSRVLTLPQYEFDAEGRAATLVKLVNNFGFLEHPSNLPKSLLMAITGRFSKQQIRNRTLHNYRPYFFVGSFMFPATLYCRTQETTLETIANSMTPGTLRGYNRHAVRNEDWPALSPAQTKGAEVMGMVLFGLQSQHEKLSKFQGGLFYCKTATVEIELSDRSMMELEVEIFVWKGEAHNLIPLSATIWEPSDFMKSKFYETIAACSAEAEDTLEKSPIPRDLYYWSARRTDHSFPSFKLRTDLRINSSRRSTPAELDDPRTKI